MRPSNTVIINGPSTAASRNSIAIPAAFIVRASFQVVTTGSATAGTLQAQFSNDIITPTNWTNVGSPVTVTGAAVWGIPAIETSYNFLRLIYTDTSTGAGNGVITARINSFGVN